MSDARRRIALAMQRFGKLRHPWKDDNLHINLDRLVNETSDKVEPDRDNW